MQSDDTMIGTRSLARSERSRLRHHPLLLLLVAPMALAQPARADTPAGAESQVGSAAAVDQHVRRGDIARRARRWAEAEAAYRAAWELERRPEIAGELGVCEVALGKHRDAAEHLALGLEYPEALSPDERRRFTEAQRKAEREVAALAISVDPPDAEVLLDGKPLGARRLSYLVFVEPGPHTVRARLAGREDAVATIESARGSSPVIELHLARLEPKPPSKLVVAPSPPPSPCARAGACDSQLAVAFRYAGYAAAGAAALAGAGMTVTAVALHGGIQEQAAALRARGGRSACRGTEMPASCADLSDLVEMRDRLASGAVMGFIASGALAALTTSSFFWWGKGPEPARSGLRAVPSTSAHQVGIVVQGLW